MVNKSKKIFLLGSIVTGLFMAITACGSSVSGDSNNPSFENSSNHTNSNSQENSNNSNAQSSQPVVLEGITAVPAKDSFEFGEELSVKVFANYSDGTSVEVTEYQVIGYNPNISGEQNVVFTYQTKITTLKIRVNDPIIVSLDVINNEESYEWGEDLDLTVTASYSDGSTVNVTSYEVSGYNKEEAGEQTVTISYQGKTTSLKVLVNNPSLVDIAVTSKESYEWGEDLDLTVTASYSDNSSKEITDYKVSGYNKEQSGEQTVTVTYEDKTYTFKVTVNNPVLVSITAVSNKDAYEYGEDLDITVIGTYSDGSTVELENYKVEGYNNENPGAQDLTITFEGKTCSLNVSVKERMNKFPSEKLSSFLQLQAIKTSIPEPVGFDEWTDSLEPEQDGSKYFYATTLDEGTVGTDSIADQYKVLLINDGWTISEDNGEFVAKKDNADAIITFKTVNKTFSLMVNYFNEFPDKGYKGTLITEKSSLKENQIIVLGNAQQSIIATSLEGDYLNTTQCKFEDNGPAIISKTTVRFTLNKVTDSYWTLTDMLGRKLGASDIGNIGWNEGSTEWTITFNNQTGCAIIMNANKTFGRLCYDPATGRMTTTKSVIGTNLVYPQIFNLVETNIIYPTSISLSGKQSISIDKTAQLSVNYTPLNSNSFNEITWSSSNEAVATVNNDGVVTAVSAGKATITARTKSRGNNLEATFEVETKEFTGAAWTIMLYLCGADLESYSGYGTADIEEILSVKNQPDDVNFIIETGGSRSWHGYNIDANKLSRYHVENQSLVLDQKIAKASMGKQSTLESFLNWGLDNYPAENTGVIFWNHGGALDGVCFDENYNSDSLTNSETSAAFKNVLSARGIDKLEFIGYDACIMQIQDVAEFNSKYFNYMVGSQESEVGEGWVYSGWVDDLYAGKDTRTILKANCDSFISTYGEDQTLSYLDLSKMPTYFNAIESMASTIKTTVSSNKSTFNSIVNSTKSFSGSQIDGYDFLNKLGNNSKFSSFSDKISAAKTAYKQLVVYSRKGSSAGNANGLGFIAASSYYYPSSETSFTNWRSLF